MLGQRFDDPLWQVVPQTKALCSHLRGTCTVKKVLCEYDAAREVQECMRPLRVRAAFDDRRVKGLNLKNYARLLRWMQDRKP